MGKSKEDFIWFVKKAVHDQKSHSHAEMYHSLLKLFVDADTNKDGLVSKASFSKLIDAAATLPRAYGYAPADSELYKTEEEKDAARQKMFDSMDLKATGVITFDEWLKFCREHIAAKTATMDPHPIIDQGSVDEYKKFIETAINKSDSTEAVELYWYMLEIFTEHDFQKEGSVKLDNFSPMMHEFLSTPVKLCSRSMTQEMMADLLLMNGCPWQRRKCTRNSCNFNYVCHMKYNYCIEWKKT